MKVLIRSATAVALVGSIFLVAIPQLLRLYSAGLPSIPLGGVGLIGLVPIAIGSTILAWCAMTFARRGDGTPAPFDPPRKLVVSGLYRFVRNPMYVGAELVLIGQAVLFGSPAILAYAALLWSVFHLFLIYYEEPGLKRRFGASYEEYREVVPRWIPRLATSNRTR